MLNGIVLDSSICLQKHREIAALFKKLKGRYCVSNQFGAIHAIQEKLGDSGRVYCEIGCYFGASMISAMQSKRNYFYIGIDFFDGKFYGRDSAVPVSLENVKNNIDLGNKNNHPYKLISGNSHDPAVFKQLKSLVKAIDILLIDGDHSEAGVARDFKLYHSLVSRGGYILFDDYGAEAWPGVKKALDQIHFENFGFIVHGNYGNVYIVQKEK